MSFDKFLIILFIISAVFSFIVALLFKNNNEMDYAIWYLLWTFGSVWMITKIMEDHE